MSKSRKAKHAVKTAPRKPAVPAKSFFPTLAKGERYAGILLDQTGKPTAHLILLPGGLESGTWSAAKDWAKTAGGELPTRQEQSLLFANAKGEFEGAWYWSCEQYAGYDAYAWCQDFSYGCQSYYLKDLKLRARALRRLAI